MPFRLTGGLEVDRTFGQVRKAPRPTVFSDQQWALPADIPMPGSKTLFSLNPDPDQNKVDALIISAAAYCVDILLSHPTQLCALPPYILNKDFGNLFDSRVDLNQFLESHCESRVLKLSETELN